MDENQVFQNDCYLKEVVLEDFNATAPVPFYYIVLFNGKGILTVDFVEYQVSGETALFTSPYQSIHLNAELKGDIRYLKFHGDFYCIDYHKKEVACNGLLFNNIYAQPFVSLATEQYLEIYGLLDKLSAELRYTDNYSNAVVRSYLQLILAISSKIKMRDMAIADEELSMHPVSRFKSLLDLNFKTQRSPSFYAAELGIAPNTFTKQCIAQFSRPPSQLIQERVILEAKKLIHLTHKSMKEIAAELNFDDENYFSRYFKKYAGVSASQFREKVGISIVADLSR